MKVIIFVDEHSSAIRTFREASLRFVRFCMKMEWVSLFIVVTFLVLGGGEMRISSLSPNDADEESNG